MGVPLDLSGASVSVGFGGEVEPSDPGEEGEVGALNHGTAPRRLLARSRGRRGSRGHFPFQVGDDQG
jgi:hypothetical protein